MELLGIYETVYDAKKAVQQQCGVSGGIAVITSNPDDIEEISRYAGYRINKQRFIYWMN
ncbi:hypothetical protein [Heyndrickxia acidiproducens]|uniref:hypothetical protein n=1 Tax=Heyndrickxia acidiproducens TaxID=1121084 RepID=UPI00037806A8|nr:hypothetical protein [Heyndrickxia acidiproducens]